MSNCHTEVRFELSDTTPNRRPRAFFTLRYAHQHMTWRELFDRAEEFDTDIETIRDTLTERRRE